MRGRGSIIPGMMILLFGVFLLLERMDKNIEWSLLLPGFAVFFGAVIWINCLRSRDHCRVFWGTVLLIMGGFFLMWNYGPLSYRIYEFWPVFPLAFGLGFLSMFVVNWRNWWALFPAIPLILVGTSSFGYYFGFIDVYTLEDAYFQCDDLFHAFRLNEFYPIILVIVGILIILSSTKKHRVRQKSEIE